MKETRVRVINRTKDSLEIELLGYGETYIQPIIEHLMKDKKVVSARHVVDHPLVDPPRVEVKVRSGSPLTALKRAVRAVSNEFKDLEETYLQSRVL